MITRGYGNLKNTACRFLRAEKSGIWSIFVTDLDQFETVHSLCNNWFGLSCFRQLPSQMIFRIAVREVESWIIADKEGIAEFLNVAVANFTDLPDNISDPKQFILKLLDINAEIKNIKRCYLCVVKRLVLNTTRKLSVLLPITGILKMQ